MIKYSAKVSALADTFYFAARGKIKKLLQVATKQQDQARAQIVSTFSTAVMLIGP
jgi:hypothetical protein